DVEGGIGSNKKLTIRKGYFDVRPYFSSPTKRAASGEKIPAQVALDRVRVTEKVYLDNFLGEIKLGSAVSGAFTAQIGPRSKIIGTLREVRGRTGVEIRSDQGGAFLKEFGAVKGATGGKLKLTLMPAKDGVSTDVFIKVDDVKIQGAPFLAELLNGISIVGLLDQLSGSGIPINEIEANFRIKEDQVILKDFTVFGPSMGITMDGYYNLKTKMMDMQGVISPIYVINGVGSLVTQKGEGLIGFNFKLKGQSGNTVLSINPLSALTPAIFRNLFRRPPPNYDE
ncbi:MAG: AsmA-like C-terminal region-containing protein, partial [Paracoccaceae bacterium]